MRIAKLSVLAVALLLIASCNKNKVNLIETTAKDEVPLLGNLTFTFDKNLVGDSVLNRWDTTEYIEFNPHIPGRFRWENPNELVFSPEEELPPAVSYTGNVTSCITQFNTKLSLGKCEKLSFHTPYLQLENANAMWNVNDGNASNAFPQIDLYFNYRVNPAKLKELLTIEVDGTKANYSLQTVSADSKISVTLMGFKVEDRDLVTKVKIDKGLAPERGTNPTDKAIETTLVITSPYNVSVQNVESDHDGSQGNVKVFMSQSPVSENLASFITFEPKVNFKTEVTSEGMVLSSEDFDVAKAYTLTLAKGLKGRIGGTLKEDYTATVAFGKLQPQISFVNRKGVYLSAKGAKNIEVRITSVKQVKITVAKIYENNLLAAQRYGYNNENYYGEDEYYDEGEGSYYNSDVVMGDVIYEKVIDTRDLPRMGNSRLFKMDIEDKLKSFKGIYHISIASTEDRWLNDSKFVSLSDIGLIAKETDEKLYVFANSIQSAGALGGVNVTALGRNNQTIGTGITDANGVAIIDLRKKDFSGFSGAMITARNGEDFNYLPFNSTHVETSRFEVGGKRQNATGLDAFVYAERDIYRPGEKINFSVITRNWLWKTPGEIPLKMKFVLPNGKELKTLKKTLNNEGSLETQIELSPSAVTGNYTMEVYSSNDVLLASKNIHIEEFMPDRIKVNATLDKKFLKPGESTTLSVNATNFFGPPAANRNYELEIQLKEKYFSPDKYSKYNFMLADLNTTYNKVNRQGKTDENGNAKETYTAPAEYKNMGLLQADFFTTVFDETGRPVNRRSLIDIYTQDVFYGIGWDGYYYCALNQPVNFPVIALNKDRKPVNAKAHIQVIKHDFRTVLSKSYSYFRYESQRDDKTIIDQEISVSGEATNFNFVPRTPGQYEIRIAQPGVNSFVKREFYSYGYWGSSGSNFEVDNEGNVDIELDKKSYVTGEAARVLFKAPFNGKMLVTLENDKVVEYKYVNVENRTASVTFDLKAEALPNAYVTATLIKPHEENDMPLTVAHGFMSIPVEETARKIPVQIFAESKVRSRTHQNVKVKATPNSKITLAVVDEGILQLTDYKTPDPYGFFYAKRALEVNSFDLYPLLFPELKGILSSTGGDGFDLSKRTNPLQNKRVKLVSYWSGITDANGNGEASFEFDIPQFSGQLRLMAVAYKDVAFGSAEMSMTVADPVVISTALPRFLSPKDTVIVPVTISNTTGSSTNASAALKVKGPLKIVGSSTQSVALSANAEGRVSFQIVADPQIAEANVTVEVNALGEKFIDETDITVRPSASLQKITDAGSIIAGGSARVSFAMDKFIPSSAEYQLIVSKNPALEIADQMYALVNYPYGCTEQTVSAAFPQLYYGDLADLLKFDKNAKANANYNVQVAIQKIKMRQLYNGAITLWDQEGTENWWATVYAAHFLLEAQKAGFDVDNSLLDNIYQYLTNRLKTREFITYYYNGNQKKQIAPKEVAYSLYVLAMAGKPQVSTMNYYKQNTEMLALDSKYLLSAAYALAGDRSKFRDMLPTSFTGEVANKVTGGSFYSDLRDEGIALNAILEVDPNNNQIGTMSKHVSHELKTRYYLSTQERAFGFLALGKIARQANTSNLSVSIKVNGKEIAKNDGSNLKLTSKQLGGSNVEISTTGTGRLYYFWQSEGITKDGSFKEEDSYLKVRKRFYDRFGHQLSGNSFTQNDLVIVAITLENSYSRTVENVVITDMLPAGFEIENPRTKEIPGMDWIKNESTPQHMDVRDDRINLFVDAGSQPQTYYYAVRAVSPGTFIMGPVMADAMYNGEYHSYNGAGTITVSQK